MPRHGMRVSVSVPILVGLLAWGGFTPAAHAQGDRPAPAERDATLRPGDDAPALEIEAWLVGEGADRLPKDRVSVVVFVASWSEASERALDWLGPRSRELADNGIDVVAVFGQDAAEPTTYGRLETEQSARAFLDRRASSRIKCAFDKRWRSRSAWVAAAGLTSIPAAFIVDRQGKVAWIGNPLWPPGEMDDALDQVTKGQFGAGERRATREKWEAVLRELRGLDQTLVSARNTGRHDIAIGALERLGAIDRLSRGYYTLAKFEIVLLELRDAPRAFAIARDALESDRNNAQLLNDLSWTILTGEDAPARDLPLAQKLGERAVEASEGKNPHYLDTLARAHADQGRLDDAIKFQRRAVETTSDPSEREDMATTLQKYMRTKDGR
ncbi:MAG: hypothetical protein JNL50_09785 [Phycisphaerae bacterium]|nr:hypothetical protein [Phycisphaerae bacterium]